MILLLFVLSAYSDPCNSQIVYSRMMPYDPRYLLHRPPVRRSAMEALERLRMPVTRYFPQVDTQVAPAPYLPAEPSLSGYELSSDDIYARPPQYTNDFAQQIPERSDNENDYGNYEYVSDFGPVHRSPRSYDDDIYLPEDSAIIINPDVPDYGDNDIGVNYVLGNEAFGAGMPTEQFGLQRRADSSFSANNRRQGMIQLSNVLEANKNVNNTQKTDTTQAPLAPVPSQVPPQVQMTAVPAAPEKKELKSLVIPAPIVDSRDESEDPWRTLGQKEEPLFRPLQNSQKTTWEVLTRAKNSVQKRPIPLLKKMIQNSKPQQTVDPLTEELKNLKKERGV